MFQQGLTDTLSATEIRQSIDQTQERTKRSTAGSSAHGFSCSRRLSPLSGRNSTYRPVQISGTGSLYAPQWIRNEPPAPAAANAPPLGAYRLVSKDSAKARWLKDVPADKQADLIPPRVFDAWANATWATDPDSSKQNPPMLRAPNGVVEDNMNYWTAGKALYDPGKITVPTLLLHAEWDADLPSYLAQRYFAQLRNTPYKRLIELSEGTHTVIMEKNRMQFFRELMGFLDEEKPLALK